MPGSGSIWRWAALAVCALIAAAVIAAPDPDTSLRSALAIHDFGHVVAFGFVTVLLAIALSAQSRPTRRGRIGMVCLAAGGSLALGAAVELAQAVSEAGEGDPWDVMRDGGGSCCAALILASLDSSSAARTRAALVSVAVIIAVALAYPVVAALSDESRARTQFPTLASFESAAELSRFSFVDGSKHHIVLTADADGQAIPAMQLQLPPGRYPGLELKYFPRNWQGLKTLRLLIVNPEPTKFDMTVRLDDAGYDYRLDLHDRYNHSFQLTPGVNTIDIPLSDVAAAPRDRRFDLAHVKSLLVYAIDLEQSGEIIVGPIVLLD